MKKQFTCFYVVFLSLFTICSHAQRIDNINATVEGTQVIVTYDLIAENDLQEFDVALYCSVNDFSSALVYVAGDIGRGQLAGTRKRIVWDPQRELNAFEGEVAFEVRATLLAPPVFFENPQKGTVFKRGKIYEIRWSGTDPTSEVQLEILKNGKPLESIGTSTTSKSYSWFVPKDIKPGSAYQIRLKMGNDSSVALSKPFRINRKIPLALTIAPAVVAGAVVGILATGGEGPADNSLPAAPEPAPRD